MKVSDIITRVGRQLSDPDHVRWTVPELFDYIDDAQRQIVLIAPDANSRVEVFELAEGTKQSLPADAIRLLRVIRNMGDDGQTPGQIIQPTLRSTLDADIPLWHTAQGQVVEKFIYDPDASRTTFYVYPATAGYVELAYSIVPAALSRPEDLEEVLELPDQYINPIVDWVLCRCFGKDSDYGGNAARSQMHESRFYQQLGGKSQVADLVNPIRRVRNSESEGSVR